MSEPTFPPRFPPLPPNTPYGYPLPHPPPAAAPPATPSTGSARPSFHFPASFQSPSPTPESDLEFLRRSQTSTASTASAAAKGKKRVSEETSAVPTKKQKAAAQTSTKSTGKGKGKAKAVPEPAKGTAHTGRQLGSHNYNDEDVDAVLAIAQDVLPIGQNAWAEVTRRFNAWAEENGRPSRTQKPLKTKFESLVRTPKPTGNAEIPPHIERAYEIERLINEKVHTRELDDGDIADEDGEESEDGQEVEEDNSDLEVLDGLPLRGQRTSRPSTSVAAKQKSGKPTAPVLKGIRTDGMTGTSSRTSASSSRRTQASEFMSAVTTSLDPSLRDGRDEARFARRLAQSELDRLTQDNRDLRTRNDALTDRLAQQGAQVHQMALENSRLQSRLDMLEMVQGLGGRSAGPRGRSRYDDPRHSRSYHRSPRMSPPRTPSSRFNRRGHDTLSSHFDHFSPPRPALRRAHQDDVVGPAARPSTSSTSLSGQFSHNPRNPAHALDTLAHLATASRRHDEEADDAEAGPSSARRDERGA
ncbi:hypothetical protein C8T65DRAFT_711342 [Cerioporus squamosus]|nr:hypothetical protein C8T65DRAFT_711342 [Cerioporus squamosus]